MRGARGAGHARGLRDAFPAWKGRTKKAATAAVVRGLHAVVMVRLKDPQYGAPTRSRLDTPEAKGAVASVVRAAFAGFVKGREALTFHLAGEAG